MECREFFGRDDDLEVVKVRSLLPLVVAVVKDVLVSGEESLVLEIHRFRRRLPSTFELLKEVQRN